MEFARKASSRRPSGTLSRVCVFEGVSSSLGKLPPDARRGRHDPRSGGDLGKPCAHNEVAMHAVRPFFPLELLNTRCGSRAARRLECSSLDARRGECSSPDARRGSVAQSRDARRGVAAQARTRRRATRASTAASSSSRRAAGGGGGRRRSGTWRTSGASAPTAPRTRGLPRAVIFASGAPRG